MVVSVRWLLGIIIGGLSLFVAACAPIDVTTPIPTQVLIPATATFTPLPITPTITPTALPAPADVFATATSAAALQAFDVPINPALVQQAITHLATTLAIDTSVIQVVHIAAAQWLDESLGCIQSRPPRLQRAIDGFAIILVIGRMQYTYHTDTVDQVRPCGRGEVLNGEILLSLDPVGAELFGLAQRRVGQELDLPVRRVRLVDIRPVIWTDSSMGCPRAGQTYTDITIDGYRIEVAVGDTSYIFHTDADRLVACDPEDEQLP